MTATRNSRAQVAMAGAMVLVLTAWHPVAAHADGTQGQTGRLGGPDRVATAVAVSMNSYPGAASAGAVVVSRDDDFADGVTGAPLAVKRNGPLLLTAPSELDPRTEAEVKRVLPAGGTVVLLGGTSALSPSVATALTADGFQVSRIAGDSRFGTATRVADALGDPPTILLATGDNFPDALVAGAAASRAGGAVLLTDDTRMPSETATYLETHPPVQSYAIGDQAAAADPVATRVSGTDRYETALAVAKQFSGTSRVGLATGLAFPDALAGAVHISHFPPGTGPGPLLLTPPDQLTPNLDEYLKSSAGCSQSSESWIYGEADVVSTHVEDQARQDLSGDYCR